MLTEILRKVVVTGDFGSLEFAGLWIELPVKPLVDESDITVYQIDTLGIVEDSCLLVDNLLEDTVSKSVSELR